MDFSFRAAVPLLVRVSRPPGGGGGGRVAPAIADGPFTIVVFTRAFSVGRATCTAVARPCWQRDSLPLVRVQASSTTIAANDLIQPSMVERTARLFNRWSFSYIGETRGAFAL